LSLHRFLCEIDRLWEWLAGIGDLHRIEPS
jgi:hypothetical protein